MIKNDKETPKVFSILKIFKRVKGDER